MKNRCAGLVVVLFSFVAVAVGNPYENFGAVIEPRTTVTRVDSVKLVSPDAIFLTPDWGSHMPYDTFVFTVGFPPWPASIKVHGIVNGIPANTTINSPEIDTRYYLGFGVMAPPFWFAAVPGDPDPGVDESKSLAELLPHLTVSPSIVRANTTIRAERVPGTDCAFTLYDAVGNRVRTLRTRASRGAATAMWNGEDDAGRRLPEGVYYCRYAAADVIAVRKVLVAR